MNQDWNSTFKEKPSGNARRSAGDDAIRDTKEAFRERFAVEHEMTLGSNNSLHGEHKESGRGYISDTAPTENFYGESIPDSGHEGHIWLKLIDGDDGAYVNWVSPEVASASGWVGLDDMDSPGSNMPLDSSEQIWLTSSPVYGSEVISCLQTYFGGNWYGHCPATGMIDDNLVTRINVVTTNFVYFYGINPQASSVSAAGAISAESTLTNVCLMLLGRRNST